MKHFKGKRIVIGHSTQSSVEKEELTPDITGTCIICPHSFSFLGDIDSSSGEIIKSDSPCKHMKIENSILAFYSSKGSSSGCVILSSLAQRNKGPLAIITLHSADYNLVEGAFLGDIPFVSEINPTFFQNIRTGMTVTIRQNDCFITKEK
ncbi:MAG: DUF126 domain-containing protein, partial [Caldisericia bacterium]|nr:DUF126 domain-containing protein [Caldisericia bacterium]